MSGRSDTRVRFAPSPSGLLHVGNARVALVNWLFARARGGAFDLRFDDTAGGAETAMFAAAIVADLDWLGLDRDRTLRQSDRMAAYAAAADRLRAAGRLYPCYETEAELAARRAARRVQGLPPVYDRAALKLDAAGRAKLEAEGRRPHWRFRLGDVAVGWHDLVRGPVEIAAGHLSDPVLIREDGSVLYALASVVDDAEFAVTHVIRGEDHVANTAAQIDLFRALDAPVPDFAHLSLLVGADGRPLAKRRGDLSLAALRAEGVEATALAASLVALGTGRAAEAVATVADLAAGFELSAYGRAPAPFDRGELDRLNARTLALLPWEAVAGRLGDLAGAGEPFWLAVRENIGRLDEARDWHRVCTGPVEPVIEDVPLLALAAPLLPDEPWDAATWPAWTAAVAAAGGKRGRALFHPLRLALTGRGDGPPLARLLPLIGRARAIARLAGKTA
ncbi:MAG: glutamate--tRNA ligase [Alphaproteobacteria bacterium]